AAPAPGGPTPLAPDPFRLFGSFATGAAEDDWILRLCDGWRGRLDGVIDDPLARMHAPVPDDKATLAQMLAAVEGREARLGDLLAPYPAAMRPGLRHLIVWLMKMAVVSLSPPTGGFQLAKAK
ncbi:MAG TPA: hypothetical protein PKZ97_17170, partial [Azospirillaceae bacterium]|nr:hypothetical protein [Azospirillaceae bacterium]